MADGYITLNSNHPASNSNQLQNFNINWGRPELNMAMFTVDKSDQVLGIHADAGLGEAFRLMHASDPQPNGFRYIKQMYVIVKPRNMHGAEFDFGEFVTTAGSEVIESYSNWNYSRSLLFSWATPYYHFGLRTNVPVNKSLTVGFQLVNAWNNLWGNNTLKNVGLTAIYTKPTYSLSTAYYTGPNHWGTTQGKRNLFDTTLMLSPTSRANFSINYGLRAGQRNRRRPLQLVWRCRRVPLSTDEKDRHLASHRVVQRRKRLFHGYCSEAEGGHDHWRVQIQRSCRGAPGVSSRHLRQSVLRPGRTTRRGQEPEHRDARLGLSAWASQVRTWAKSYPGLARRFAGPLPRASA